MRIKVWCETHERPIQGWPQLLDMGRGEWVVDLSAAYCVEDELMPVDSTCNKTWRIEVVEEPDRRSSGDTRPDELRGRT